jgi:hypothetical protein
LQEQKLQERLDQEHKREKFNMPMHGKKKKGMARGGAKMKMRGGGMGMMGKKKKSYAKGGAARRR